MQTLIMQGPRKLTIIQSNKVSHKDGMDVAEILAMLKWNVPMLLAKMALSGYPSWLICKHRSP